MAVLGDNVVPRVGTWIEIPKANAIGVSWQVVPRVGTWIEISIGGADMRLLTGRSPRGDVD